MKSYDSKGQFQGYEKPVSEPTSLKQTKLKVGMSATPIVADQTKDDAQRWLKSAGIYMTLRISHVQIPFNDLVQYFFKNYEQVIICEEEATSAGVHYHLLLLLPDGFVLGAENRKFKQLLKDAFPELTKSRTLSCSILQKIEYTSYILKDGKYFYKGFADEFINTMASKSYKKFDKTVFAKEWDKIRMDKTKKPREKCKEYIKLKRKYNQNIKESTVVELMLTFMLDDEKNIEPFLTNIQNRVDIAVNTPDFLSRLYTS